MNPMKHGGGNLSVDLMICNVYPVSYSEETGMSFEEALAWASRDESFKATVYAMNTLLIGKGIYTQDEFQELFVEWIEKEQRRMAA